MNELEKVYRDIQPKVFAFFYIKLGNRALAEDLTHDVFYYVKFSGSFTKEEEINMKDVEAFE